MSFLCDYIMQIQERIIQLHQLPNGQAPFEEWLQGLNDKKTKARILQRLDRIRLGNFGNCRSLGSGIYELKISWRPGFRIYYGLLSSSIILLLCGGDKGSQKKDIDKARQMWEDFKKHAS